MNLAIIEQIALYIPLILGAYLSISMMKISNLSIESAYVFGGIMASQVLMLEGNVGYVTLLLALLMSMCGGAMVGIIAAVLAEYAYFSHILSAIITIGLFHGISLWILGGSHITISGYDNSLRLLEYIRQYPELPTVMIISLSAIILFYFLLQTQLGISCALYGDNISFLKNYRINQSYVVIAGMAMSNALAGLSGYMIVQSNGFVDITMGIGLPLLCLSALIIGKSLWFSRRPFSLVIPLLGICSYFLIQQWLLQIGFDLRYFIMVQASIIASFLIISSRIFKKSVVQKNLLGI